MVKIGKTRTKKSRSRSQKLKKRSSADRKAQFRSVCKPSDQKNFGIVAIDCAKARSKWMLADFYGLSHPATIASRNTVITRPMTTIWMLSFAAVNGFGLNEKPIDAIHHQLQILARHRRDLVRKRSKLQCQIRHHLEQGLPGFGALFGSDDLWTQVTPVPLLQAIAKHEGTVDVVKQAGQKNVTKWLDDAKIRFHKATIVRVVVWAANAAEPDPMAIFHTRVWTSQLEDWTQKTQQIDAIERDLEGVLAKTSYVLLLSHPGINVVTAAELAGEMGPIENYASAKAVCGRAGLFPSRYQSDEVDRTGKLTRFRNAKLRAAWLISSFRTNLC